MGNTTPPFYFNDVLKDTGHTFFYGSPRVGMSVDMGNTMIIGQPGTGKAIRVFTCKADTADITRLPSQSISVLANAIKENCQTKIKFKS
ncbi:hypothetical protein M988_4364 [Hafnia paralvei ATCC 29927]|uniref:hypothetical protein n=1 Tax=Hafnia paralvei TaxID=546367 RepID=UPI0007E4B774|nr:hypothetical protein [Hafnia paralvei]OAT36039.1 hypothetical protein M988_4364 [Hafnia paralvei ATCC 29927]